MSRNQRNLKCACGSGIKYKYCCLRKKVEADRMTEKLANRFRDQMEKEQDPVAAEAAKHGDEEMLRRDQFVTMRHLQIQRTLMTSDEAHRLIALKLYETFLDELEGLPLSECRQIVGTAMVKRAQSLQERGLAGGFPRESQAALVALESLFGERSDGPDPEAVKAPQAALEPAGRVDEEG